MTMVQVLDTTTLPATDRAEAFQATVSQNCSVSTATFADARTLHAEMHVVDLGPAKVFTIDASGTTLRRTPRIARAMNESSVALALPLRASNRMMWEREQRLFGPRDLILVDLSSPYVYSWPDGGASYAFHVDFDQLGLPMDTIHTAARELRASPIYPLVRDHISYVTRRAETFTDGAAAVHVGAATAELMHALIVSAAGDSARTREAMHASAAARVQSYVRRHLRDPDLSAARVAAANGLSTRALYKLYEAVGISLEQSVIQQRLQGAKADLGAPDHQHRTIGAIARSWGFGNPSHFSQRFRQEFGVTPRQWRASEPGSAARRALAEV